MMATEAVLEIQDKDSVVRTRQAGRDLAKRLGFGSADQTRLATAISELVRNVLQHGGGTGTCQIQNLSTAERLIIRVIWHLPDSEFVHRRTVDNSRHR